MTAESIIALVCAAFRGVPRPAFTLADAAVAEGWGDEHYRFAEHDQSWEEIPDASIKRACDPFCFLPITSWSYYLPAYMVYCIRRPGAAQELILTALTPANSPGVASFRGSLTPDQRHAVSAFLSFQRNLAPPKWRELLVRQTEIDVWAEGNVPNPASPKAGGI